MPKRNVHPDELKDCFELYLLHNGERHDLIEKEMLRRGWSSFKKTVLKSRGFGKTRREGWIEKFGWQKSLEVKIATAGTVVATSAESLLFEVEQLRKKLFLEMQTAVLARSKDLVYQHNIYVARSIEILDKLESARDNLANFVFFIRHLLSAAPGISPTLAKELVEAESALIEWAESKFVTSDENTVD